MNNLKFSIITFYHKYQVLRQLLSTMNPTNLGIKIWDSIYTPVMKVRTYLPTFRVNKIEMTFIASVILRLHCFISASCYYFLNTVCRWYVYCLRENLIIFHYFMSDRCVVILNRRRVGELRVSFVSEETRQWWLLWIKNCYTLQKSFFVVICYIFE